MTMSKDGLYPDEEEIISIDASCIGTNQWGEDESKSGELVLVNKGLVFLFAKGLLGKGRTRGFVIEMVDVQGIRQETKGITGSLFGSVYLIIHAGDKGEYWFTCKKEQADEMMNTVNEEIRVLAAGLEFMDRVHELLKAREEANLSELAEDTTISNIWNNMKGELQEDAALDETLQEMVTELIKVGDLRGVIEGNRYVSKEKLDRKSVQYQVSIDFSSLLTQLQTKGIVLQKISCPSCNGEIDYPKDGSTVVCKFCNSTVHATDIFEKFKGLL